jgi:hypothetical protein
VTSTPLFTRIAWNGCLETIQVYAGFKDGDFGSRQKTAALNDSPFRECCRTTFFLLLCCFRMGATLESAPTSSLGSDFDYEG